MKKIMAGGLIIIIFIVDFTALDDITTGEEPSFYLEYLTLGVSAIVLALVIKKFFLKG